MNVQAKAVTGCKVGYARVSSEDQNLERQFEEFRRFDVEKIYFEKVQGDKLDGDRPELLKLMDYIREGDTVYFASFDRLSRRHLRLLSLIEEIKAKGVAIHFIEEAIYISPTVENPYDELNANIFSAFAQFFKKQLKIRQRQGIKNAKKDPTKYKGRKPKLEKQQKLDVMENIILGNCCYSIMQEKYEISRSTVWRIAYQDPTLADERNDFIKANLENQLGKLEP
jgi:DNA invertase Pin-like site-specific DNA recombinase